MHLCEKRLSDVCTHVKNVYQTYEIRGDFIEKKTRIKDE